MFAACGSTCRRPAPLRGVCYEHVPEEAVRSQITGADNAADRLTIDFSFGEMPVPNGIWFDDGKGGNNRLVLDDFARTANSGLDAEYTPTGAGSGTVALGMFGHFRPVT